MEQPIVTAVAAGIDLTSTANSIILLLASVPNAPSIVQLVQVDISTYLGLLHSVRGLIEQNGQFASHLNLDSFRVANEAVSELMRLVGCDPVSQDFEIDIARTVDRFQQLFTNTSLWPTQESNIKSVREELERQRSAIFVSFCTATMHVARLDACGLTQAMAGLDEQYKKLNAAMNYEERRRIIEHCFPPNRDMRDLHDRRKELQEPGTCDWISRDDNFRGWLESRNPRFLWIHGIPGTGKTVLAAHIIEMTAAACNSEGYGFYYCLYSHKQDETVSFLTFVLRQLCTQKKKVSERMVQAHDRDEGLSVEGLLDCLAEVSRTFAGGVHIVVDAIDESSPRDNLIKVLCQIGSEQRFGRVFLLCTSREESDIIEPVNKLESSVTFIDMANPHVKEDIERYIHRQLTEVPFFLRYYDDSLRDEVKSALTRKAKGMFRWAVCQLDVLKRTRGSENVREAIQRLPEDIFSTYERILTEIPPSEREFARTALALICSDTAGIPTAEVLVKASLWSVPFNEINKFTASTLKEICGSLIQLSRLRRVPDRIFPNADADQPGHRCSLAHYTVKEYLYSSEIANGNAKFFALDDQLVSRIDLRVKFAGLGHFGVINTHVNPHVNRGRQHGLSQYEEWCLKMTESALKHRRADIMRDEDIRDIVAKSLSPTSAHFRHLRDIRGIALIMKNKFPIWQKLCGLFSAFPDHTLSGLLVNLAILEWPELATKFLASSWFRDLTKNQKRDVWTQTFTLPGQNTETVLGYCLREKQMTLLPFLRAFVRHGGASFYHEPEALYTAMLAIDVSDDKVLEALEFLLSAGANPDPEPHVCEETMQQDVSPVRFVITPLQHAIYELDYEWTKLLLEEGAIIDRTGARDGVIPVSFRVTDVNMAEILQDIGQQTALQVCSTAQPSWLVAGEDASGLRQSIMELLRRYGAQELVFEESVDEDESMMDIGHQDASGGRPIQIEHIDLTMDPRNSRRY
ncbi:hypothetical protein F4808DRAFT_471324 [Astrocystis sublimbata]|nr:hypothetical protein F4808DRAFT_471324 [Astrocystis sublimbata]